jgi:hypothetical protein
VNVQRQNVATQRRSRVRAPSITFFSCAAACLVLAGCGSLSKTSTAAKPAKAAAAPVSTHTHQSKGVSDFVAAVPLPAGEEFLGQFFDAQSPWNTQDLYAPTDVRSDALIRDAMRRVGVIDEPGDQLPKLDATTVNAGVYINTKAWTDPVVQGGPLTPIHCRQLICGDDDQIAALPVPANVSPNPLYDGWFTIISPNGRTAYDLWRARRLADRSISFQYMRIWNLDGSGYGAPGQSSARGSGLPLFAGLIRPQELQNGQIDHALAISVPAPATRNYVPPASTTDGNGATDSLPEGARIRLKANAQLHPQTPLTPQRLRLADALMWTLRTYGAIVVGRAAVPTLYAQRDVTSSLLIGNELQSLGLTDFEVVQLPSELQYPSASQQSGTDFAPGPGYGG